MLYSLTCYAVLQLLFSVFKSDGCHVNNFISTVDMKSFYWTFKRVDNYFGPFKIKGGILKGINQELMSKSLIQERLIANSLCLHLCGQTGVTSWFYL